VGNPAVQNKGIEKMTATRLMTSKQILSRREALMVLAATGGAAAASLLLPEKWVQPVVEAGILPAHAQSSIVCAAPYTIDHCRIYDIYHEPGLFLHYVSTVYLKPACAGVPITYINEILDENLEILVAFESSVVYETNSRGEVTNIFSTGIGFGTEHLVSVSWKIARPNFGTDICTAIEHIPAYAL
jgi:hypothetical protein